MASIQCVSTKPTMMMMMRVLADYLHCLNLPVSLFAFILYITENYSEQVEILRSTFHERFNHLRQIAQRFLKKSHKPVWKCDKIINNGIIVGFQQNFVSNHRINSRLFTLFTLCLCAAAPAFTSYTEIANFLQGFVDNEANLNAAASCAGVCSDYRKTAHFQCQSGSLCDRNVNDHEQAKCGGIIRDCQDIDDSDVNICETVSEMVPVCTGTKQKHYQ